MVLTNSTDSLIELVGYALKNLPLSKWTVASIEYTSHPSSNLLFEWTTFVTNFFVGLVHSGLLLSSWSYSDLLGWSFDQCFLVLRRNYCAWVNRECIMKFLKMTKRWTKLELKHLSCFILYSFGYCAKLLLHYVSFLPLRLGRSRRNRSEDCSLLQHVPLALHCSPSHSGLLAYKL